MQFGAHTQHLTIALCYPQIVNVDQGSQFTADAFVSLVTQSGAQISMDGKGSWRIPAQRDRPFQQYDRSFQMDCDR